MRLIILTSAGLRHKLSKLQLRAPGYPKGPPCIQRGPQKKKKKKTKPKKKKERKEKIKSESRKSLQLPPPSPPSNLRSSSTTPPRNRAGKSLQLPPPLEFTNFIDYPPSKSGRKIAPTTPSNFLFLSFPPFFKLRAPHRLNPALILTFSMPFVIILLIMLLITSCILNLLNTVQHDEYYKMMAWAHNRAELSRCQLITSEWTTICMDIERCLAADGDLMPETWL